MAYLATFERIGRNRNVEQLTIDADEPNAIADAIHGRARRNLGSRFFTVMVDLAEDTFLIEGGRFGRGTLAVVTEQEVDG